MSIIYIAKKKKHNSRLKSKTPIVFSVPEHQKRYMKEIPRKALENFKKNEATANTWECVLFRMSFAYELAVTICTEVTIMGIKEVIDMLLEVRDRRTSDTDWVLTSDEIELLISGLDAMDAIEDLCTRRIQLDAVYKARDFVKANI
jgi:hypothetical protein